MRPTNAFIMSVVTVPPGRCHREQALDPSRVRQGFQKVHQTAIMRTNPDEIIVGVFHSPTMLTICGSSDRGRADRNREVSVMNATRPEAVLWGCRAPDARGTRCDHCADQV